MANNPALAFLAGMRGVEMNRVSKQNRAFQAEQQSWLRTAWARKDEAYEKAKLDAYRAEKAMEFSLISDEIMEENQRAIDAAEAAGDLKTANELRAQWFDGPDAKANIINEGWKRQLQRDPGIGELFGLVQGQDPAAGPFVRDPRAPVSGFGVAPPSSPFAGQSFIEIDSVNGNQPMTEGRGAGNKDNVWSTPATLSSLYAMYGSPELIKQYQIFGVMMEELGANKPTGKMESVDTRVRTQPGVQNTPDVVADEIAQDYGDDIDRSEGSGEIPGSRDVAERRRQEAIDRRNAKNAAGEGDISDLTDPIAESTQDAVYRMVNLVQAGSFPTNAEEAGDAGKMILGGATDLLLSSVGEFVKSAGAVSWQSTKDVLGLFKHLASNIAEPVVDFTLNLTSTGGTISASSVPDNAAAINAAHQANPETPSVAESTANAATTREVVDKTPMPTPEALVRATSDVVTNQGQGAPPPEEVYKALMQARAGLITLPELMQFKRTGRWGESAEVKFINMGKGILAATRSDGSFSFTQVPGFGDASGAEQGTIAQNAALQNYYEDLTKGIENEDYQQQLIDAMQGAATIHGVSPDTEGGLNLRANSRVTSMLRQGANLLARFDEDKIQGLWDAGNLDFTWGDYEVPINSGNLALAGAIAAHGLTGDQESVYAIRDWARDFRGMKPAMPDSGIINRINMIEPSIKSAIAIANSNGTAQLKVAGNTITINAGDDAHNVRQKYFEALAKPK
jgi:hypothetical protein